MLITKTQIDKEINKNNFLISLLCKEIQNEKNVLILQYIKEENISLNNIKDKLLE